MRVAALYSGGKDSTFATWIAEQQGFDVVVLVNVKPEMEYSWMYHSVNVDYVKLQADAMEKPLLQVESSGEKEKELADLKKALEAAIGSYGIEGVVAGALRSDYQKSRIDRVSEELGLRTFAPLWRIEPFKVLKELVEFGFKVLFVGVFAAGFDQGWLGRELDSEALRDLKSLVERWQIDPCGEGGEYETFVYDAPLFKKRIKITKAEKAWMGDHGVLNILSAELVPKPTR